MRPSTNFGLLQNSSRVFTLRALRLRQNHCLVETNRLSHDGCNSLTSGRPVSPARVGLGCIRSVATLEFFEDSKLGSLFREIGNRLDLADRTPRSAPNNEVDGDTRTRNDIQTLSASLRRTSTANVTSEFCKEYISLPDMSVSTWSNESVQASEKRLFFDLLFKEGSGIDENVLISTMATVLSHRQDGQASDQLALSNASIRRLRELCTPRYERIFNYILASAHQDLGVAFLVKLRQDLRELIHWLRLSSQRNKQEYEKGNHHPMHEKLTKLRVIERDIQSILSSLFRPGVLNLQQITYDRTPASIIEQIAFKEAVHPLQSLKDLRTRLGPGRRCFAFFHPALRDSPLVFVHVALLRSIPESMRDIETGTQRIVDGTDLESEATCAAFYSITNAVSGLSGVDLGNHLIKSVVGVLKHEFPTLGTYCTLSPIPNFRRWLEDKMMRHRDAADRRESAHSSCDENNIALLASDKFLNADLLSQQDLRNLECLLSSTDAPSLVCLGEPSNEFKPLLMKLAAYYLTVETHHGRPLCPVAKFHIRNGAEMYRLNYLGDATSKGLRNSCGIMINYRYLLEELEENHVNYESTGKIAVRDGVRGWLAKRSSCSAAYVPCEKC
ncbi:hypothetical protein HJC23_013510 [Cyclotella cryptica]|uniref:Malonyl-CoA decarboxylase C-terminal domain-containing protein n=1 Tax=Cyclotella cryptica TaxID=29204 RepID=A0ABD3QBD2_9STRA|eukprot:CCRYP_006957-RA/>CCRYP_006957-RA protein AED:0.02 eAED:0.02 QI:41/1/1/1/1/1/2/152/613